MTKPRDPEALLSAYLAVGMEVIPDRVVDAVLEEIHRTHQRAVFGPWRTRSMFKTALGAAAVAVAVSVAALLMTRPGPPAIGGPTPAPTERPSHSETSAAPSASPSPSAALLLWTVAGLEEDWPAPVRSEPVGGGSVLPVGRNDNLYQLADPVGDNGSSVLPWADILVVQTGGTSKMFIVLADNNPPLVDPTEQWIAYGVVVDANRDGVPDVRYGIDNLPVDPSGWAGNPDTERMARDELANGAAPHRAWRTDLHPGRTASAVGPPYGVVGETYFDTFYPPGGNGPDGARISFGGDLAGGGSSTSLAGPFYTWAAVIENGRVVAIDYAPDVGWLDPWAAANP